MLFTQLGIRLVVFTLFTGLYLVSNRFAHRPRYMRKDQELKAHTFPISCLVLFTAVLAELIISASQIGWLSLLLPANLFFLVLGVLVLIQGINWSVNEYKQIQEEKRTQLEENYRRTSNYPEA